MDCKVLKHLRIVLLCIDLIEQFLDPNLCVFQQQPKNVYDQNSLFCQTIFNK